MKAKNILIIRDLQSAIKTAKKILDDGYYVKIAPQFKIKAKSIDPKGLKQQYDYIIITSFNAVSYLQSYCDKSIPIILVGQKTAEYLAHNGWQIELYESNINRLSSHLREQVNKYVGKKILYLSGEDISEEIDLKDINISINRQVAYKAEKIHYLKKDMENFLRNVDIIFFYSNRTADIFLENAKCVSHVFEKITAICISEKVSETVSKYRFKKIKISKNPTEESMLKACQRL